MEETKVEWIGFEGLSHDEIEERVWFYSFEKRKWDQSCPKCKRAMAPDENLRWGTKDGENSYWIYAELRCRQCGYEFKVFTKEPRTWWIPLKTKIIAGGKLQVLAVKNEKEVKKDG
jgi:transposase-like protein